MAYASITIASPVGELTLVAGAQGSWRSSGQRIDPAASGCPRSYRDIAVAIGQPNATRAVGAANGRNPLSIVTPCHRVVGAGGALTGFAGGIAAKRHLLGMEAAMAGSPLLL